jgi:uncharacterized protein YqeY
MKISDQINEDLKDAMRAKDKVALEALRAAKTAFTLAKTQEGAGGEISEADELKIIQRLVKQRKESADIYKQQSRLDLYDREVGEAAVLEKYLPVQLSVDELKTKLKTIITDVGATGPKDMGKVMGIATKELFGKADGKIISQMVKELLNS